MAFLALPLPVGFSAGTFLWVGEQGEVGHQVPAVFPLVQVLVLPQLEHLLDEGLQLVQWPQVEL